MASAPEDESTTSEKSPAARMGFGCSAATISAAQSLRVMIGLGRKVASENAWTIPLCRSGAREGSTKWQTTSFGGRSLGLSGARDAAHPTKSRSASRDVNDTMLPTEQAGVPSPSKPCKTPGTWVGDPINSGPPLSPPHSPLLFPRATIIPTPTLSTHSVADFRSPV